MNVQVYCSEANIKSKIHGHNDPQPDLICQSNDMNGKDLPGFPPLASFNHDHIMLGRCTKPSDDLNNLNQGHKPLEASPKETQDLFQLSTSILRIS